MVDGYFGCCVFHIDAAVADVAYSMPRLPSLAVSVSAVPIRSRPIERIEDDHS